MALPVLPAQHIQPVFEELAATSPPVVAPFVEYVRNQWIGGRIFNVGDISVFGMEARTNNDLEGYHNRINNNAQKRKCP